MNFLLPARLPNPTAALRDAGSDSADIRWVAAQALGLVNGPLRQEAIDALKSLLRDPVPEVRAQAGEGLLEQFEGLPTGDIDWLTFLCADESAAVRCVAVDAALVLSAKPEATLLPFVHDPDPSVRLAAVRALGEMGESALIAAVIPCLEDEDEAVRTAAAVACAALGSDAGESILSAAAIGDSEDAEEAILGLGRIGRSTAAPILRTLAARFFGPQSTKIAAATALFAVTNGAEGRPMLTRFLNARKAESKLAVLSALCRLPVVGLADEVAKQMRDVDELVVSSAIQTLVALSVADPAAASALREIRQSLSGTLADEAAEAILTIESELK